jgi:hypothetical protein
VEGEEEGEEEVVVVESHLAQAHARTADRALWRQSDDPG